MPELPEVETVAQGLRKGAVGQQVTAVEILNPVALEGSADSFAQDVMCTRIMSVARHGKVMSVELAGPGANSRRFLMVHLGMTGQFLLSSRRTPLEPHTHVRLVLGKDGDELRFRDVRRFGWLRCCSGDERQGILSRLGPDALDITVEQFAQRLQGRRGPIKSALLNQKLLAGVGNIYADEALFEAHIHPLSVAGGLSARRVHELHRAMRKVLRRAIALRGTSFRDYRDADGDIGRFWKRLRVYRRAGELCRRCGSRLRRIIVAGRSTHFCARCQPKIHSRISSTSPDGRGQRGTGTKVLGRQKLHARIRRTR